MINYARAGRFLRMAADQCDRANRLQAIDKSPEGPVRVARTTAEEALKLIIPREMEGEPNVVLRGADDD